ncbi:MAG: hypothetical protein POG74_09255 [Acidocella sp.]|nr:hypothetical protein [Acidocella sp.]
MQFSELEILDVDLEAAIGLVDALYVPENSVTIIKVLEYSGFDQLTFFESNQDFKTHFHSALRATCHFLAMIKSERRPFPINLCVEGMRAISSLKCYDRDIVMSLLASLCDSAFDMGPFPNTQAFKKCLLTCQSMREYGGQPYFIFGDSHSRLYRRSGTRSEKWLLPIHVCFTAGSAIGLRNPTSKTGYGETLKQVFEIMKEIEAFGSTKIFLQFGQVDVEFLHPFRRIMNEEIEFKAQEFQIFCETTIEAYINFLTVIIPDGHKSLVYIVGIFPPALNDDILQAGYTHPHISEIENVTENEALKNSLSKLQWPNKIERTKNHAYFNNELKIAAIKAGFKFISDFDEFLNKQKNLAENFIAFSKGQDHHLDFKPSEMVIEKSLWCWLS